MIRKMTIPALLYAASTMTAFAAQEIVPATEAKVTAIGARGTGKRSGNPRLTLPADRRNAPPIPLPKKRVSVQAKKDSPPPDWVYRYNCRTGEVDLFPPGEAPEAMQDGSLRYSPSNPGRAGDGFSRENIIGSDDRQRILDTTLFPWSAIGKVFMWFPDGSQFSASGSLITDFHVYTAGHVVHHGDFGGWADYIEFVPGMDGDYEPFDSYWDTFLWSTAGWVDNADPDFDWGLVEIDRPIGSFVGHLGYAYHTDLNWYIDRTFNLAGYPGDLDQGFAQYHDANRVTQATEWALFYLMDTTLGQSGSPVWALFENTGQHLAMAVHGYGDALGNSGARINETVFNRIAEWTNYNPYPPNLPDLVDDGVEYSWFDPGQVDSNELFAAHCEVRNIGTTESLPFWITFHVSPDDVIEATDPIIGSVWVDVPNVRPLLDYYIIDWVGAFPMTIPDGQYYVGWRIDSTGLVPEYFEDNNTAYNPIPLIVGTPPPPNIHLMVPDFFPSSPPNQVAPGDAITMSVLVQNTGGTSVNPFWLEFWGSRTGGFSNSIFVTNSVLLGPYVPGGWESYATQLPLWSIPDGPYTIVMQADRPNQVAESDETDNRVVVGGKRMLVLRPETGTDLEVVGFTFGPDGVHAGQSVNLGGIIRNSGTQDSGPFWVEFWGSYDQLYPRLDFFICDSISVTNLAPGQQINLGDYSRTLYGGTPAGRFMVGVVLDRPDQISERDETNNYTFIGNIALNQSPAPSPGAESLPEDGSLPDLVISQAYFSPAAPTNVPPGTPLTLTVRVENLSSFWSSQPVWLEFWGSRTGGLTLDELIVDSQHVPALAPWQPFDIAITPPLYSVPDGPYTIVAVVDRPNQQAELREDNNRFAIPRKRLLTIRPVSNANLIVEGFSLDPHTLQRNQTVGFGGRVRNVGADHSGPFWIEFIGTFTPNQPNLDMFLCDSILVSSLAPGQSFNLIERPRTLYPTLPTGPVSLICFPDRTDLVYETHEEDNYTLPLTGYTIVP